MDAAALGQALAIADAAANVREAAAVLRRHLAPLRVMVVDAFDMRHETPAAVGQRCTIFLAASDGHCWQVTGEAAQACGLYLCEQG